MAKEGDPCRDLIPGPVLFLEAGGQRVAMESFPMAHRAPLVFPPEFLETDADTGDRRCFKSRQVTRPGFEPGLTGPKPVVLPLHYRALNTLFFSVNHVSVNSDPLARTARRDAR